MCVRMHTYRALAQIDKLQYSSMLPSVLGRGIAESFIHAKGVACLLTWPARNKQSMYAESINTMHCQCIAAIMLQSGGNVDKPYLIMEDGYMMLLG